MTETKTANIWDLSDLCTPWCVHVVATLKIANHIQNGITEIDALAEAANCDADVLHAVLDHLAAKGLFEELAPGVFRLNDAARPLLNPVVQSSLDLESIGGRMAHAWSTLLSVTRTGDSAYADVFGRPFFEDLAANPDIAADFDMLIGPSGHGTPNANFDITGGWDNINIVMDVGGGTGAMLAEILRAHPHMQGILVDTPSTTPRAVENFHSAGVTGRVQTVGQSFFDPLPAGADIYLLRGIINDWPDRESIAILRRCAEAARPAAGRVVILKSVGPDDRPKDLTIEMVLLGGKHRTVTEFRALAAEAGLEIITAGEQAPEGNPAGGYFVVECRPV